MSPIRYCYRLGRTKFIYKTVNNSKEDSRYIPKEATKVLGSMLEHVIPSPKLKGYSKVSILQMVVTCYTVLEERQINDIGEALLIHTTTGNLTLQV